MHFLPALCPDVWSTTTAFNEVIVFQGNDYAHVASLFILSAVGSHAETVKTRPVLVLMNIVMSFHCIYPDSYFAGLVPDPLSKIQISPLPSTLDFPKDALVCYQIPRQTEATLNLRCRLHPGCLNISFCSEIRLRILMRQKPIIFSAFPSICNLSNITSSSLQPVSFFATHFALERAQTHNPEDPWIAQSPGVRCHLGSIICSVAHSDFLNPVINATFRP